MYIRITFAITFLLFIAGLISLKIQNRQDPLIFDNYLEEIEQARFTPIEDVDVPYIKSDIFYEVTKTQQHGFHVLPSSF